MQKKTWAYISLIIGITIGIAGIGLIAAYIQEAFISRIGQPDQSLLFWYLPILFIGFISSVAGLSAIILGLNQLKKIKRSNISAHS